MFNIDHPEVIDAVHRALYEDIGSGDITTDSTIPEELAASGIFTAKQDMVVAGTELLCVLFGSVRILKRSGELAAPGDALAEVRASAQMLLTRERVSLNFLQRLSGIATLARAYVDAVAGTGVQILDTRKTTPGLRRLEKSAAAAGGVVNHRLGLFDAILIKNNHIALAGSITIAVERARASQAGSEETLPFEVEVRTRAEIDEALGLGVKSLLLDNMTPAQAAEEIQYIAGRATAEISGGVTLATVAAYAAAKPNFISVGAITHSATAVDINLRVHAT